MFYYRTPVLFLSRRTDGIDLFSCPIYAGWIDKKIHDLFINASGFLHGRRLLFKHAKQIFKEKQNVQKNCIRNDCRSYGCGDSQQRSGFCCR